MLKIGIVGNKAKAGYYDKILSKLPFYEMKGYFSLEQTSNIEDDLSYFKDFLNRIDAVIFTENDFLESNDEMMSWALRYSKSIFTEGYLFRNHEHLSDLAKINREASACFHVGLMRSTGPVFTTTLQYLNRVKLIESEHYISEKEFNSHDILYKYLAQDVDMILKSVCSNIQKIKCQPISVFGEDPEVLKVKLDFDNGASAQFSYSCLGAPKSEIRFYVAGKYFIADLQQNKLYEGRKIEQHNKTRTTRQNIVFSDNNFELAERQVMPFNHVEKELLNFYDNSSNKITPLVDIEESLEVMKVVSHVRETLHPVLV